MRVLLRTTSVAINRKVSLCMTLCQKHFYQHLQAIQHNTKRAPSKFRTPLSARRLVPPFGLLSMFLDPDVEHAGRVGDSASCVSARANGSP
jgi:hypothetical protein